MILRIIHYPLSIIHYPLSIIHYPLSIIHYPLSIIHYLALFEIRKFSFENRSNEYPIYATFVLRNN
jgi:hypothetical protein